MKKIFILIICLLTGCQSVNNHTNNEQRNADTRIKSIVSMTLLPHTPTYPHLSVEIENAKDVTVLSGNEYDYKLMIDVNGKWEEIERKPYVNYSIAYSYESSEKRKMVFHLKNDYGELKKGKYRLIKEFFTDSKKTSNNKLEVNVDFYI